MNDETNLLEVSDLSVHFRRGHGSPVLRAVDRVSFSVAERETLGVVGESGSGKSTIGRAVLGLVPPTDGRIEFAGEDITRADHRRRRALSRDLQVIFQDPYSSLNPTRTVAQTLGESLRAEKLAGDEVRERVVAMLERVGLPASAADRHPSGFSGGQRQRIAIARALVARPRLVICDEPVSALDLSVQAQVLNLLRELQDEFALGYVFVAHDLDVVRHLSHRIMVLYRGQIMEQGPADAVHATPAHPYTRTLLDAAPVPDPVRQAERRMRRVRTGDNTGPVSGTGCPFAGRCLHAAPPCRTERPPLEQTPAGTTVACHRWRELGGAPAPEPARGPDVATGPPRPGDRRHPHALDPTTDRRRP
ncbi:ABC transporter ATP-binding protein [Streptomyces caniscabiei]|uniref:ABC transporter ATP-binding protein n=1 Tax=Streptomyces caniscabiei TaxID=2746961 RepID=UPI0038F79829